MKAQVLPTLHSTFIKSHLRTASLVIASIAVIGLIGCTISQITKFIKYHPHFSSIHSVFHYENRYHIFGFTFLLIMASLLLSGIHKKKPRLMVPGLLTFGSVLVYCLFSILTTAWHYGITGTVFRQFCYSVLLFYSISVQCDYYKQLKEDQVKGFNNFSQYVLTPEAAFGPHYSIKVTDTTNQEQEIPKQ